MNEMERHRLGVFRIRRLHNYREFFIPVLFVKRTLGTVNQALEGNQYLVGNKCTIAGPCLCELGFDPCNVVGWR